MRLFTINKKEQKMTDGIDRLKSAVQGALPGICPERAIIWTEYHRNRRNRKKPAAIRMAEALSNVLMEKTIVIYDDEIIVGNYTSKRVGGSLYPELHGIPIMLDMFKFNTRKTNPLKISPREIASLLKIIPFWMFRFLGMKAFRSPFALARFIVNQLRGHFYIVNESGGISHLAPDYEKLIAIGTDGIIGEARKLQDQAEEGSEQWNFYRGVQIIAEGLARFGERYADLASRMAFAQQDAARKRELSEIAVVCSHVPRRGARSH